MVSKDDADGLYQKWLGFLFDRAVTDPPWYFQDHAEDFEASAADKVRLLGKTFLKSGKDLLPYSDSQLALGLHYIFSPCLGCDVDALRDKAVAENLRLAAVQAMRSLYKDCLAPRCVPSLSHTGKTENPLNGLCYMLWDETPLQVAKGAVMDAVLEVMEHALYLPNPACIESGLHGLGHSYQQHPQKVEAIIARFLAKSRYLQPDLMLYAKTAQRGMVQ